MRFLITGLGSIGQRYARIIREIYGNNVEIHAYRKTDKSFLINSDLTINKSKSPSQEFNIIEHKDIRTPLNLGMDIAFITNRPHEHIETSLVCAKYGTALIIEKPISHNDSQLVELQKIVKDKKLKCIVSHQLRYHPIAEYIRNKIHVLGDLIHAEFIFSEYLPHMHKYENYIDSHASHSEMGGGAILSLDHDIDINMHFLGAPKSVISAGGNFNILGIKAEEIADMLFTYKKKEKSFISRVFLDFTGQPTRREWRIRGTKASIVADLIANSIQFNNHQDIGLSKRKNFENFIRDDMFAEQIKSFVSCKDQEDCESDNKLCDLSEAIKIHLITLKAKKSLETNSSIEI